MTYPYPIEIRNELFRLFQACLSRPDFEQCLSWLALIAEQAPKTISELASLGEEKGLHHRTLIELVCSTNLLDLIGPQGKRIDGRKYLEVWFSEKEHPLGLKPEAEPCRAYILDRLHRHLKVLGNRKKPAPAGEELKDAIRMGQALFNAGLFFDCHEYLEGPWKNAQGESKKLLQGLIQLGAALHKLEIKPSSRHGALEGLDNAIEKLEASLSLLGVEKERLDPIQEIRARLAQNRLDLAELPELHLI